MLSRQFVERLADMNRQVRLKFESAALGLAKQVQARHDERVARQRSDFDEAEDWVIKQIVGDDCIHSEPHKGRGYCDDCPIGNLRGELSYGASKMICTKQRSYSK